jgi:hypothetical protein
MKDTHKEAYQQKKLGEHIWNQPKPVLVFKSKRAPTLHFVLLVCLLLSIFTTYLTITISEEEILKHYSSTFTAIVWQVIFFLLANILLAAILWLSNRYILAFVVLPHKKVEITTWHFLKYKHTEIWNASDFAPTITYDEGITAIAESPRVNAPYLIIRSKRGKKRIFDLQGNFPYRSLVINALIKQASKA